MSSPTKPIAMLLIALTLTTSMAGQEKVISDAELNELMLDTLPSGVVKLKSFKEIRTALKTKKNVAFFDKITAIALSYEEYETAMKLGASMYPFIDKTRQEVDRAVALLEKLKQFKSKVDNSMVLGDMDAYAGFLLVYYDLEKSQAYFTKAIATFQPVSDEETFALARVYLYRAKTQKFMGNYAEATQDYITSADYFHQVRSKKSGAQRLYFQALSENASIYTDLGMPVLAKGQLIRVVEEKNKSGFTGEIAQDYYLLSMAYGDLKQHGLQRKALVQASQNTRSDDPAIAVAIYAELCNYSIDEKQFKLAKKYLDTLENIVKTNDFTTQRNKLFLQTKANYLASVKQYDEASSILGGLLKESSASNNVQGTMAVHDFSYLINKWNGNYKKALYHFEAKSALLDSSANKKNKQLFQYYQTQFETEKKEKDILAKQLSIDKLSAENKAQTRMLTFGGVSAFLLFG